MTYLITIDKTSDTNIEDYINALNCVTTSIKSTLDDECKDNYSISLDASYKITVSLSESSELNDIPFDRKEFEKIILMAIQSSEKINYPELGTTKVVKV